jgi:hypothetical protein
MFIKKDDGTVVMVHADAGPLFRAFDAAFGMSNPIGQMIEYDVDSAGLNVMTHFIPLEN